MSANAKPLWMQLPDGALKRQLLADIAQLVQLGTQDLEQLWLGKSAAAPRRTASPPPSARRVQGRTLPHSRASRALQIVFTHPEAWERLSHDDHHLLCALPAPHGTLFAWLDSQHHDHGPQPWEDLRAALRGHEHEDFALAEVGKLHPEIESDPEELADILAKERRARLDEEMKRLAAAAPGDPAAFERYKALLEAQKPRPGS